MGYSQWLELKLDNKTSKPLYISDFYAHWGKLYASPDKNTEVNSNTWNGQTIAPGEARSFATCGRENASSGAEGDFNVSAGNDRICQIYYSCPWSGSNQLNARYIKDKWFVVVPQISISGSLGSVTITFLSIGMSQVR